LFPSDMAVSLGFCRYSPCLRMCHRMARPQGCVDHAVCLQPQTARQPLRCFFLCRNRVGSGNKISGGFAISARTAVRFLDCGLSAAATFRKLVHHNPRRRVEAVDLHLKASLHLGKGPTSWNIELR
jgi:hypothetical protein